MEKAFISGLLYTELDDEIGPNPVVWLGEMPQENRLYISIKTITVLSGEGGLIPDSLVILPFPSLNSKGLIKYIKWEDPNRRGGIGQAALTLLFKEINDVIFYKYMSYLDTPFEEASRKIKKLELSDGQREQYMDVITELDYTLTHFLDDLRKQEMDESSSQAFPEKKIKDANLIDYKFKISICGDPGVGKTSLILRFTDNAFRRHYIPTLGVHVSDKIFKIKDSYIQLVLWDIAGQTKFETMRQQFYLGSDGLFLIFDRTNPISFDSIQNWYYDVQNQLKNRPDLIGYIIGNKSDLSDKIAVQTDKGNELANYLSLGYFEASALTGQNVEDAFYGIAEALYESVQ